MGALSPPLPLSALVPLSELAETFPHHPSFLLSIAVGVDLLTVECCPAKNSKAGGCQVAPAKIVLQVSDGIIFSFILFPHIICIFCISFFTSFFLNVCLKEVIWKDVYLGDC